MSKHENRRTKIVCTLGPSSESAEKIEGLIDAGMNVARLNFSHGSHDEHAARMKLIREIAARKDTPVAILQDLSGPKIRVGKVAGAVPLEKNADFVLYANERIGDQTGASTTYPKIVDVVKPGEQILLADGSIALQVLERTEAGLRCRVESPGILSSNKGVNLPSSSFGIPSLTSKDLKDLEFGLSKNVDYLALSFVREKQDVLTLKQLVKVAGKETPIIAKIEKGEALANIDEIIDAADGVMVARGDLAVEVALERVPVLQKMIIARCNKVGKPVITATQMLKTMVESPRPTRAEAADVANAVLDGTDAVMLSEETAIGKYPVETVSTMCKIVRVAEKDLKSRGEAFQSQKTGKMLEVPASVSRAAILLAKDLKASAIVTPTKSGSTARMVARFRPGMPIIALCTDEAVQRRLSMVWGVKPFLITEETSSDEILAAAMQKIQKFGLVNTGDRVVITAGVPIGVAGTTNLIKVEEIAA